MTAEQVKDKLRRRHPALWPQIPNTPGEWVCLEEWQGVDLVAFHCWSKNERIGYEVKVSRSDLRRELLRPYKREPYKQHVDYLYLAVPKGLLTGEELSWQQPLYAPEDFEPQPCSNTDCSWHRFVRSSRRRSSRGPSAKGKSWEGATVTLGWYQDQGIRPDGSAYSESGTIEACCVICGGRGKAGGSRVEQEAPTLWIPPDVGLIEVSGRGCHVTKKAPRLDPPVDLNAKQLADLVRWASFRPDPRHRSQAEQIAEAA